MFHVKICGITRPDDAVAAVQAGADAIGLNFAPPSPRAIDIPLAREIAGAIGSSAIRVGVFVNHDAAAILECASQTPLDAVQLHGDEPAEMLLALKNMPVVKAFRLQGGHLTPITKYLEQCRELRRMPAAVLVDAYSPDARGGTGHAADWEAAGLYRELALPSLPKLILAGGLNPKNVAMAIGEVRPHGVDTASGVEISPGIKDAQRTAEFISAARRALGLYHP